MSKYHEIMNEYCDDVLSGKIAAGVYTIKAIKRYINDLKREKEESFDFFYFYIWRTLVQELASQAIYNLTAQIRHFRIALSGFWRFFSYTNIFVIPPDVSRSYS